ncbi:MAG TPA: tetratricopeptide repeat protein [Stellaceae bacterium]|nr:tetratricopeptide repeat protein [Stellaceae bacterium]
MDYRRIGTWSAILGFAAGFMISSALATPINQPDIFSTDLTAASVSQQVRDAFDAVKAEKYDQAIATMRAYVDKNGKAADLASAYEVLGMALYLHGDADEGVADLKQAATLNPNSSTALTRLGSIALNAGQTKEAKDYFTQALKANPGYLVAHERLGIALQLEGDISGATSEYEKGLAGTPPSYLGAKPALASLYNEHGRYKDALALLKDAVSPNATDPLALRALGIAYIGTGDAKAALPYLTAAQKLDPKDAANFLALGVAQRLTGALDESIASLNRAIELKPNWAGAEYQAALTLVAQKKYDEARDFIERAAKLDPNAVDIGQGLGDILLASGKPDDAIATFKMLTARSDARLSDYVALATADTTLGRFGDAEKAYRDAVSRFPANAEAYRRLGASLALQRKYTDATNVFDRGLKIAPTAPALLRDASLAEARLHQYGDAIALAQRLVAADPQPGSRFLLATLYQDSGNKTKARELYREIVGQQPDFAPALNNLAALLAETGDATTAVPLAQHAVQLAPTNAAYVDTLGWTLLQSGQHKEAVTVLQHATELAPNDPEERYRTAVAQKAMGDLTGARQNLQQALAAPTEFRDASSAKALLAELDK